MNRLRRTFAVRIGLVLTGIIVVAIVFEIALRLAGFEYHTFPIVKFGWPNPQIAAGYRSDPDLFWVPKNYSETLESARRSPPPVVFMGDSSTQFGTYPEKTLRVLSQRRPSLARGFALGVAGWTSEQGLRQLQRDILPLRPRIVTLLFGWNDHWVALGSPDADVRLTPTSVWLSDHVRTVQLWTKAQLGFSNMLQRKRVFDSDFLSGRPNRVSLEQYASNLESMVRLIRGASGRAVVVTAPANHVPGEEPNYLRFRNLRNLSELVPLHRAYVDATRRAARETGAVLCDAAAAFERLPPPRSQYFGEDGIHLREAGDQQLAELLAPCIEEAMGPES